MLIFPFSDECHSADSAVAAWLSMLNVCNVTGVSSLSPDQCTVLKHHMTRPTWLVIIGIFARVNFYRDAEDAFYS